ncbi:hypothetical protein [Halobellus inordinatus]|uniref:hypothetical protein n=1 Tax=Halobellus inordinatus TaxID=1126236 RepID=UPI00211500FA|nr:hypothetical protein [Halobellus ramosii]
MEDGLEDTPVLDDVVAEGDREAVGNVAAERENAVSSRVRNVAISLSVISTP